MPNKTLLSALLFLVLLQVVPAQTKDYYFEETPEEFKERMAWFKDAQFGMFIHFGLYSQLGGVWKGKEIWGIAEWIQAHADIPSQEYAMLTHTFNPKNFDADKIVKLAKDTGMKYLVVTSKHHEGFALYDSKYTNFDVASTPFKGRDILRELKDACDKYGIKFGTYYSILDWHHISQERNIDGDSVQQRWKFARMKLGKTKDYETYVKNQVKELIENYDTEIMWFDGEWCDWWTDEMGINLYNYIRSLKPSIIINNRCFGVRENFEKDFGTPELETPDSVLDYNWEACYTLNDSWGFKMYDKNWKSPETVYNMLKEITGKGGNFLLNIGPDGNGDVPQESIDVLLEVGKMLNQD
ncbi:alpha-L-fucosidase [Aestuariibaculum sediminum]|uniref:alpha-L-fucosidase n=1 Tax=Aestuariibaculum sediminum TaxID=2770637 RepID=A0A8J6QC92_9FLAO|nr:alpha-L-fucosidase [Aestuariibaculum sediminum]MBD0833406.1 alpha-L-fucosidase [Aestuariibaculum sediminum]